MSLKKLWQMQKITISPSYQPVSEGVRSRKQKFPTKRNTKTARIYLVLYRNG